MKGQINSDRGTLLQMCVEFESGQGLVIQPLYNDTAVIAFGEEGRNELDVADKPKANKIMAYNHKGELIGEYEMNSPIKAITNTVIYPDGRIWTGKVFEDDELRYINYVMLTTKSLKLLKNSDELTFDAPSSEKRPTILARLGDKTIARCGNHTCGACNLEGKLIPNGLTNDIV